MVGKRLADITEVPREDHQVHVMVADDSLRVRRPPNMMLVDGMPLDPDQVADAGRVQLLLATVVDGDC